LNKTQRLINEKGEVNLKAFTVMAHTSIASLIPPFDFLDI
jgi:hypothetical protein